MKKIIAMLLCVAMVAAMGITASAATVKATPGSTIAEYYEKLTAKEELEGLAAYADALKAAKDAAAAAKKNLETNMSYVKAIVQGVQYELITAAYDAAVAQYQAEVELAIAQAYADAKLPLPEWAKAE